MLCCLAIPALALLLFHTIIVGSRTLYFGDISLYFVPMLAFQKSELLQGRIPLWNLHILCGTPFVGNPQAWPLYPSSLLLYVFRPERVVALDGVSHLIWAALGTFLFLRQRSVDRLPALFAALAWGFGGALVSKMQFPNMVQAASYLPWLLWGVDRLVDRPTVGWMSILGALIGLALLAAHPQMFLMQFYVVGAWTIWRVAGSDRTNRRPAILTLVVALAIGGGLAFGQLLPVVQMVATSVRTSLTIVKANRFILPPYAALYNLVAPNFYGNPATPTEYVARGNFWEPCAYGGFVEFCLAIGAAVLLFRRAAEIRFWAIVALVAIWLALGRESGLYAAAFYVIPGVSKFHDAARWLQPATFALACLAAHGLHDVGRRIQPRKARLALCLVLVVVNTIDISMFVSTLNPTASANLFSSARANPEIRHRAWYGDEGRLWGKFVSYRTYDRADFQKIAHFIDAVGPNLTTMAGYDLVNGYEPVHSARIETVLTSIAKARGASRLDLLRSAGADTLIELDPFTNRPTIVTIPGAHGRAWIADRALFVKNESPDLLSIAVSIAPRPGTLIVADALAPGWSATIDGKTLPISLTNNAFRSIGIPAQASRVSLKYEPCAWRLGAFVTLLTSGILSVIAGITTTRRLRTWTRVTRKRAVKL